MHNTTEKNWRGREGAGGGTFLSPKTVSIACQLRARLNSPSRQRRYLSSRLVSIACQLRARLNFDIYADGGIHAPSQLRANSGHASTKI